jgi:hypothetical protein
MFGDAEGKSGHQREHGYCGDAEDGFASGCEVSMERL